MSWAVGSWHIVEAKAAVLGVTRPGGPASLLDLDGRFLLAFIEGVLRESPDHDKALTKLYETSIPIAERQRPVSREERNAQIQKALRLFGG